MAYASGEPALTVFQEVLFACSPYLEYTCSKYCNLIGLSEVHYFHRDLQAKIETYNFYKIYKIVLISKKSSLFSVLLLSETELFSQLALILLPHNIS